MIMRRRGFLARLLAALHLPLLPALPARAEAPRATVHDGWILTERDLSEIARLDR